LFAQSLAENVASTALGAAKAATDVLDRSGITAVADDSGIEDGTRTATQAYNTEEMAVSVPCRNYLGESDIVGADSPDWWR
jgi:hypothetical protein